MKNKILKQCRDEIRVMQDMRDRADNWRHPAKDRGIINDLIERGLATATIIRAPNKYFLDIIKLTRKGLRFLKLHKK